MLNIQPLNNDIILMSAQTQRIDKLETTIHLIRHNIIIIDYNIIIITVDETCITIICDS